MGKKNKSGYVYLLSGGGYYKIGLAIDIDKRIAQISPKLPFEVELVHCLEVDDMYTTEAFLHEHFADRRQEGEWFTLDWADINWFLKWDGRIDNVKPCQPVRQNRDKIASPGEFADRYGDWVLFVIGVVICLASVVMPIIIAIAVRDASYLALWFVTLYTFVLGIILVGASMGMSLDGD